MTLTRTKQSVPDTTGQSLPMGNGELAPSCLGQHISADVAILTGGFDKPYAFGLSMALAAHGLRVDVIGSDDIDCDEMHRTPGIRFLNFQSGWRSNAGLVEKIRRVLGVYGRLLRYALGNSPRVFHILWNGKLVYFDRTLLTLTYKLLGKRLTFTAHNVNTSRRDGTDTWLNRLTLKSQYRLVDRLFVHTDPMKRELSSEYGVVPDRVCVIPFGINNAVPHTDLQPIEAKRRLGLSGAARTLLFFGRIQPYKGLENLIEALEILKALGGNEYQLIIAGEPKKEHSTYWSKLQARIENGPLQDWVLQRIQFIPDEETEIYFKAADVLVLPYSGIYQSGVLFLGYSFGLPVIATDVGTFTQEVIPGQTGFLCRREDPNSLARAIAEYFDSPLYRDLDNRRVQIQSRVLTTNSWDVVAARTVAVYRELSGDRANPGSKGPLKK